MKQNFQGVGRTNLEGLEEQIEELLAEGWWVEQRYALGEFYSVNLRRLAGEIRRTGIFLQVMISGQPISDKVPPFVYSDVWLFIGPFANNADCITFRDQLKVKLVEKGYSLGSAILRTVGEVPHDWAPIAPEDFKGLGGCNGMIIEGFEPTKPPKGWWQVGS